MQNRAFNPETIAAPAGPYTHGVAIPPNARICFVAGQIGIDKDGNIPADFRAQADLAWQNCLRVLEHDGMRIKDVVKVTHFLLRASDIPAYNEVRMKHLGAARPASTLLIVAGLFKPEVQVEVEMVAALS